MKKSTSIIIIVGIIFFLLAFGWLLTQKKDILGYSSGYSSTNYLNEVTHSATSTIGPVTVRGSVYTLPTLVLERDAARQYALIENDSASVVYIYLKNYDAAGCGTTTMGSILDRECAASTTAKLNTGIRLDANGGHYEIKPENLYIGDVYASGTASGINILTTYR